MTLINYSVVYFFFLVRCKYWKRLPTLFCSELEVLATFANLFRVELEVLAAYDNLFGGEL